MLHFMFLVLVCIYTHFFVVSIINMLDSLWKTYVRRLYLPRHFLATSTEYILISKIKIKNTLSKNYCKKLHL